MADRCDIHPGYLSSAGEVVWLEKLPHKSNDLRELADLRDLVLSHPQCLPINQIDPSYGPLIPIGKEVGTDRGPIDCLFISPNGLLTIVETKLWRNVEARRQVVGQILDYAKEVAKWTYSELDAVSRKKMGMPLWGLVQSSGTAPVDVTESSFVDQTSRALRTGAFLLLIVGDGIREDVEDMVAYLQGAPQLLFSMHLIELQFYSLPSGGRIVIPQRVARTKEVERAVIRVYADEGTRVVVDRVDGPSPRQSLGSSIGHNRISEAELLTAFEESSPDYVSFIQKMLNDVAADERLFIDWQTSSFVVKAIDPIIPKRKYSLVNITVAGNASVWAIRDQFEASGLPTELAQRYVIETAQIVGAQVKNFTWSPPIPLARLAANYDAFKARMLQLVNEIWTRSPES